MCNACKNENHSEIEEMRAAWVLFEGATHIVTGWTCAGGGIETTAADEFTAHRWARLLRRLGWSNVKVLPNDDTAFGTIQTEVESFLSGLRVR